jgi:hypothetical protein
MHPLHQAIGDVLRSIERPGIQVLLDAACGGKGQQIRLFGDEPVGNSSCLAWVDAAIIINGEITVVLEIEESNVRPLYLCGKVFATALCNYSSRGGHRVPMAPSMLFIQVIRSPKSIKSAKLKQCEYLEKTINQIFRMLDHRVHSYSFHYGLPDSFQRGSDGEVLRSEIAAFIDIVRLADCWPDFVAFGRGGLLCFIHAPARRFCQTPRSY